MKKSLFLVVNIFLLFFTHAKTNAQNTITLSLIDSIEFDINPVEIGPSQPLGTEEGQYIYFFRKGKNILSKVNIYSGEKTILQSKCITSQKIEGFSVIDSTKVIFEIMNRASQSLLQVNYSNNKCREYIINPDYNQCKIPPFLNLESPYCNAIQFGNLLYLPAISRGEFEDEHPKDRASFILLDVESGEYKYIWDIPEAYYNYNWGGLGMRSQYNDVVLEKNLIVVSYPISDDLYVYNIKTKTLQLKSAKSTLFSKVTPFKKDKKWFGALAKMDYLKYFYENYSYEAILYDKYRKLYYRFVRIANNKVDFGDTKTLMNFYSIIILNDNFKKVGEYKFEKVNFQSSHFFVSEKGLYIRKAEFKEDKLVYYIFNPVNIKK